MGVRLNPRHTEMVRQKIQAGVLIDRLSKHANGKLEMTPSQIKAAEILLDRSIPKLSQIQHSGDEENPIRARVSVEFVRPNP